MPDTKGLPTKSISELYVIKQGELWRKQDWYERETEKTSTMRDLLIKEALIVDLIFVLGLSILTVLFAAPVLLTWLKP